MQTQRFLIDITEKKSYTEIKLRLQLIKGGIPVRFASGYISVLHRYAVQFYNKKEKDTGIRGVQYPYLFYICRHEGCRQEELAEHLHVNKSNVTRQLEKLEQNGFIDIRPDESDGRGNCVFPTDKALRSLDKVRSVLEQWNEVLGRGLTAEESEQLKALLGKALGGIKEWEKE